VEQAAELIVLQTSIFGSAAASGQALANSCRGRSAVGLGWARKGGVAIGRKAELIDAGEQALRFGVELSQLGVLLPQLLGFFLDTPLSLFDLLRLRRPPATSAARAAASLARTASSAARNRDPVASWASTTTVATEATMKGVMWS